MKKVALLSMDNLQDYQVYDHLLIEPFNLAGWQVETISWRAQIDWRIFDLVIIRSTWDYQANSQKFIEVLQQIEVSGARLENPLRIVKWNINKQYLLELENKGILTIPTVWVNDMTEQQPEHFFEQLNCRELVIKPCVGASASDTYRLDSTNLHTQFAAIKKCFKHRQAMVQPFVNAIVEEGEFSLFFFDNHFSHAILKRPKQNDFRVQEEWGGSLYSIQPEISLLRAAEKVLNCIGESLLYCRLDFVRTESGFALIEAELIEPSLYFNMAPDAASLFVSAVENRLQRLGE